MIVYYAIGGGFGHLSRAKKIIHQFGFNEYKVITSSIDARIFFEKDNLIIIPDQLSVNVPELQQQIVKIITNNDTEILFIDSFPYGILGELNNLNVPSKTRLVYVCRYLNWEKYLKKVNSILKFSCTYLIEDIEEEHYNFVKQNSLQIQNLEIKPLPQTRKIEELKNEYLMPDNKKIWLIIHSGNKAELESLINYAVDIAEIENISPYFLIISNLKTSPKISSYMVINYFPASDFFEIADRIFSGAGFNILSETKKLNIRHHIIPFERKYDNQFWRVKHN